MIGHRLNSTLTVYRPTYTSDGAGGRTRVSPDPEVGTIRAQVNQPTTMERLAAAQLGNELTHVVHTTFDVDVERDDLLDNGGARRLRVRAVVNDSRETYKRLECEVVQSG